MGIADPVLLWVLWLIAPVAGVVLLGKLWITGLHRIYRCFFAYLVFAVIRSLLLMQLGYGTALACPRRPSGSYTYFSLWAITEPIGWAFYILVVLELCFLIARSSRGSAASRGWILAAVLTVSALISVLITLADFGSSAISHLFLLYFTAIERTIGFSLALSLLVILLLLYRSSVPVRRNIVVHSMVLSFYSLAGAITLLLYQRVGDWAAPAVNVALLVITDLSRVAWIVFLNRESERKPSG